MSAGHDISDGGLITAVLEMAFAGNCGVNINLEFDQESKNILKLHVYVVLEILKLQIYKLLVLVPIKSSLQSLLKKVNRKLLIAELYFQITEPLKFCSQKSLV